MSYPEYEEYVSTSKMFAQANFLFYQKYHEVYDRNNPDEVQIAEIERRKVMQIWDLKIELRDRFVITYCSDLEKHDNYKKKYFEDIKNAIKLNNLDLLELLLWAPTKLPLSNPLIDVLVLNYLAELLKKNAHDDINLAKYLFEQVLDTAENNQDEYSKILKDVFLLNEQTAWYDNFKQQIQKLVARCPVNKKTFDAVILGLSKFAKDDYIREDLRDYLDYEYVKKGLADTNYKWAG